MRTPSLLELAYLAGVLDSDGHIAIDRGRREDGRSRAHRVRIRISQAQDAAIKLAADLFGGSTSIIKTVWLRGKKVQRGAPLYSWTVAAAQAANVLREVLPFLRIKRAHAELCLQLQDLIDARIQPRKRLTDHEVSERENLADAIRILNLWGKGTTKPQKKMIL